MKGWLRDPPLAEPEIPLARQEPVAEYHAQLFIERALPIVAGVVLKHMPDVGGIRDQEPAPRADLEVAHLAVAARGIEEHRGRVPPHGGQHAQQRDATRSRRARIHWTVQRWR